jgi:hypothetical protein
MSGLIDVSGRGMDRATAREQVAERVEKIIAAWRRYSRKPIQQAMCPPAALSRQFEGPGLRVRVDSRGGRVI